MRHTEFDNKLDRSSCSCDAGITWCESGEGSSRPQPAGCPGQGGTIGLAQPGHQNHHYDD